LNRNALASIGNVKHSKERTRPFDDTGDIQHVFVTGLDADSLWRILFQIA
jgi:hypothetical protein